MLACLCVRSLALVCGGIGACMFECVWYTELTCIPHWASETDIVGQVLGPSLCGGYRCLHACVRVV